MVLAFFNKLSIWVFNGFGSYEIAAVNTAFDVYDIPRHLRPMLMDRITIIMQSHAKIKKLERDKEGK